jgi:hypothetical protein
VNRIVKEPFNLVVSFLFLLAIIHTFFCNKITAHFSWDTAVQYFAHDVDFTEPIFVVIIMILASTRPILKMAEWLMMKIAVFFGNSIYAWWLTILTVSPLLGSFITEPAAMTIAAQLLAGKFYELKPEKKFQYATFGLLFVNISVLWQIRINPSTSPLLRQCFKFHVLPYWIRWCTHNHLD